MRLLGNHLIFQDRNPSKTWNMLRHILLRRQQSTAQETIALHCLHLNLCALKFGKIAKIRWTDRWYHHYEKWNFWLGESWGFFFFFSNSIRSPLSSDQVSTLYHLFDNSIHSPSSSGQVSALYYFFLGLGEFSASTTTLTVSLTPINHTIFWNSVIRTFRCLYGNCFQGLGFLAEVSTKLHEMHFFRQFKDHNLGKKHRN